MSVIQCHDIEEMTRVCVLLLRDGIVFTADTNTYKVTLTGGF
jgi:hypothetical protein